MTTNCYYKILGITKKATHAEIKKAYRTLCLKYHPDRNLAQDRVAATEKMKEINDAYRTLGDPERREIYVQFGDFKFVSCGVSARDRKQAYQTEMYS